MIRQFAKFSSYMVISYVSIKVQFQWNIDEVCAVDFAKINTL